MSEPLRFVQGTITVSPEGYWYTSGGDKGSFGYYPHLKDDEAFPVYPDTQIMGDLRMAADWLVGLTEPKYSQDLTQKIFGRKDGNSSGFLFSTDLKLTEDSKRDWNEKNFQVKPRTAIEDGRRTVESHMLVNLEMAYLNGLALTADIFLYGAFSDKEFKAAKELLQEACLLLSGFGAFRSRGYGRGKVELDWKEGKTIAVTPSPDKAGGRFTYALTSEVHFRNKQIEPGTDQLLISRPFISSEQVRGWFVKAYHAVFHDWPTPDQMSSLIFTPLYPSLKGEQGDIILGFPPAMTTLRNEEEVEKDVAGRSVSKRAKEEAKDKEGVLPCMSSLKPYGIWTRGTRWQWCLSSFTA